VNVIVALIVGACSAQATTYREFGEFDNAIRIADHVVAVEIAGSKILASANSPEPCAVVYRGRVLESLGPREVVGEIAFASDVQLKTGARYLLFLAAAKTASGSTNPYTELFVTAPGREDCAAALSDLSTDLEKYAFEIRTSENYVSPPSDPGTSYVALDYARLNFPDALTKVYEHYRLCKENQTGQQCDIRWETTLMEWGAVKSYVRSHLQDQQEQRKN